LPVGFKFIGECIKEHEDYGDEIFIFGGEESFGCLKGSYARDKDASSAALLAAEMVSWLKDQSKTVWDLMDELRAKYGFYLNDLLDLKYEGAEGFAKMAKLMENLRNNPPKQIGEWTVSSIIDRKTNEFKSPDGAVTGKVDGHTANVIIFNLSEDGKNQVVVRPSGTEPKVKLYIAMHDASGNIEATKAKADKLKNVLKELAEQLTQ
jgi:phosphoglucomutase